MKSGTFDQRQDPSIFHAQNDEWTVQRTNYMTLENTGNLRDTLT